MDHVFAEFAPTILSIFLLRMGVTHHTCTSGLNIEIFCVQLRNRTSMFANGAYFGPCMATFDAHAQKRPQDYFRFNI